MAAALADSGIEEGVRGACGRGRVATGVRYAAVECHASRVNRGLGSEPHVGVEYGPNVRLVIATALGLSPSMPLSAERPAHRRRPGGTPGAISPGARSP